MFYTFMEKRSKKKLFYTAKQFRIETLPFHSMDDLVMSIWTIVYGFIYPLSLHLDRSDKHGLVVASRLTNIIIY
jgi:hypothetical protein